MNEEAGERNAAKRVLHRQCDVEAGPLARSGGRHHPVIGPQEMPARLPTGSARKMEAGAVLKLMLLPVSPYARKAWIVAIEKGLEGCIEHLSMSALDDPPPLLAANPVGLVPTLIRENGDPLYDSIVITEYLDSLDGSPRFYPRDGEARWDTLRAQALADGMLDASISILLDRRRPEGQRSPEWQARWVARIGRVIDQIEKDTATLDPRALGLAQIVYPVALDYVLFRSIIADWRPNHQRLADWFATAAERPSFQRTDPRLAD
ncbi:MAG: glutathione S-transferase family protein [Sphingobium sp.]